MIERRTLLTGIGVVICAPAIVRASSLMPVRAWRERAIPFDVAMTWIEKTIERELSTTIGLKYDDTAYQSAVAAMSRAMGRLPPRLEGCVTGVFEC